MPLVWGCASAVSSALRTGGSAVSCCRSPRRPLVRLRHQSTTTKYPGASGTPSARGLSTQVQGQGFLGCLGRGDFEPCPQAQQLEALKDVDVCAVAAGWGHSAALTADGKVLLWGRPFDFRNLLRINNIRRVAPPLAWLVNKTAHLADDRGLLLLPKEVHVGGETAVHVSCSAGLTAILTREGSIFMLGINRWGQCGIAKPNVMHVYEPTRIAAGEQRFTSVALGFQHALALRADGAVCAWGKGERGQLGADRLSPGNEAAPRTVALPEAAGAVAAGFNHSTALSATGGRLYVWGKMQATDVKHETTQRHIYHDQLDPLLVEFESPVVSVVCTLAQTFVWTADGKVHAMGMTADTKEMIHEPVEVYGLHQSDSGARWTRAFQGWDSCILLADDGAMVSMVLNSDGVHLEPYKVPGLDDTAGSVEQLAVGWQHQLVLTR